MEIRMSTRSANNAIGAVNLRPYERAFLNSLIDLQAISSHFSHRSEASIQQQHDISRRAGTGQDRILPRVNKSVAGDFVDPHQVDVAVPHAGHQDFDVGGFDVSEECGDVFAWADVFDRLALDYDARVVDGLASSGNQQVGSDSVHFVFFETLVLGICFCPCREAVDTRPVILDVDSHLVSLGSVIGYDGFRIQ